MRSIILTKEHVCRHMLHLDEIIQCGGFTTLLLPLMGRYAMLEVARNLNRTQQIVIKFLPLYGDVFERPPPKVAPVGMTPGGVLLRENRMYGCENSVHKEPPVAAQV